MKSSIGIFSHLLIIGTAITIATSSSTRTRDSSINDRQATIPASNISADELYTLSEDHHIRNQERVLNARPQNNGNHSNRRKRTVSIPVNAEASIAQTLTLEHNNGNTHPHLTLHAKVVFQDETATDLAQAEHETEFVFKVREPIQAVTAATIISNEFDGTTSTTLMGESDNVVLVADTSDDAESSSESGTTIAIIVVNQKTGLTNGIVYQNGRSMRITQDGGGKVLAHQAENSTPPGWRCSVGEEIDTQRHLTKRNNNESHHHHNHHTHEEVQQHHHHHHESRYHGEEDMEDALSHMKRSLRGSNIRFGKRRNIQEEEVDGDELLPYNFQVDLFIEIDDGLIATQGGSLANAKDYVNSIVTAANSIYEPEIDTHLNVIQIVRTANYDNLQVSPNQDYAIEVVQRMRTIYAGPNWHHPGIDLHYALLGSGPRRGYALYDSICNSESGFGASTGLVGTFTSVDELMVYDMYVFAHEVGHNFGSRHTHDGYDPAIDTCGDTCPRNGPDGLVEGSATLMSYCNICTGWEANIAYTFGGRYNGNGDRTSIESYNNTAGIGDFNVDPRRVNVIMYEHVSTRGVCTDVTPPSTTTNSPTMMPSKTSSTTTEEPYYDDNGSIILEPLLPREKRNNGASKSDGKRSKSSKVKKSSKHSKSSKKRKSYSVKENQEVDSEYPG